MGTKDLIIAKIGNSRGVRIPADVLRRYAFTDVAVMVENADGILLRPKKQAAPKLSWADTAQAMAASSEDWSDWETTAPDGLTEIPWETASVAEKPKRSSVAQKESPRRRS